jgi:hypothetical protein
MTPYETEVINNVTDSGIDVFGVPVIEEPAFEADAHEATITGVTPERSSQKGTPAFFFHWTSKNSPMVSGVLKMWLPLAYVESGFDPKFDLSGLTEGQKTSFRINIGSSKGSALLQRLVKYAAQNGRSAAELGLTKAASLEGQAANYNSLLAGCNVIALRVPDKDNPEYPVTQNFVAADAYETSPKTFLTKDGTPKYRLAFV